MNNYTIKTPHAAVLIWNYVDRVAAPKRGSTFDATGISEENLDRVEGDGVVPVIVSTLSCISIQTQKTKGRPDGAFNLVLAPFKNWTETLTAGSWCVLLMSNEPITEKDLKKADRNKVKMLGRIETVRCETKVGADGARQTLYYVSGIDWGNIFNSQLYIDNLIKGANDEGNNQGDVMAIAIRRKLFSDGGSPQSFIVRQNLQSIIDIMGKKVDAPDITRLANAVYEFTLPKMVSSYFDFRVVENKSGRRIVPKKKTSLNNVLSLITGPLKGPDQYDITDGAAEAMGFIDPFSLQGTHTLWQVLQENSNPAMNEMICEMRWNNKEDNTANGYRSANADNTIQFTLFNRIKPFAYKGWSQGVSGGLTSYFQYVKTHEIPSIEVVSINAGTNWRDKINFIEIKPQFQDFKVVENWYKQKSQVFDPISFKREGFRPLIVDTKQFPKKTGKELFTPIKAKVPDAVQGILDKSKASPTQNSTVASSTATPKIDEAKKANASLKEKETKLFGDAIDWNQLRNWALLMREWYFDTHRMLNGTIEIHGSTKYIAVGDNIRFDAGLINPTPNINNETKNNGANQFILAHVETVSHSFSVNAEGARSYRTTINFVRGIVVNENNLIYGEGALDQDATKVSQASDRNTKNTVSTSVPEDPDPKHVKGN